MSFGTSFAHVRLEQSVDLMTGDLERIIGRICRADPHLILERESDKHWTVVDRANGDAVMMRAGHDVCVKFMRAFETRHPESTVDHSAIEHSWKVAQDAESPLAQVVPIR